MHRGWSPTYLLTTSKLSELILWGSSHWRWRQPGLCETLCIEETVAVHVVWAFVLPVFKMIILWNGNMCLVLPLEIMDYKWKWNKECFVQFHVAWEQLHNLFRILPSAEYKHSRSVHLLRCKPSRIGQSKLWSNKRSSTLPVDLSDPSSATLGVCTMYVWSNFLCVMDIYFKTVPKPFHESLTSVWWLSVPTPFILLSCNHRYFLAEIKMVRNIKLIFFNKNVMLTWCYPLLCIYALSCQ